MLRWLLCVLGVSVTLISGLPQQDSGMGFDTGNPAADHEAGMWTAALIGEEDIYFGRKIFYISPVVGTLMAAIPVALLNPSLGFKRKRRSNREFLYLNKKIFEAMISNIKER